MIWYVLAAWLGLTLCYTWRGWRRIKQEWQEIEREQAEVKQLLTEILTQDPAVEND
jgi:hypothetical protein